MNAADRDTTPAPATAPAAATGGAAEPALTTCSKCGATAMAFICAEPGCPVNGGAAYPCSPLSGAGLYILAADGVTIIDPRGHRLTVNGVLTRLNIAERVWAAPASPPPPGVALPTIEEMAERLRDILPGNSHSTWALHQGLKFALTGLPPGPDRDAALARLAQPGAGPDLPPLSDAAATLPPELMRRARAIVGDAMRQAGEGDRAVMLGAVVQGMAAALEAALAAPGAEGPAGDGWSSDMDAAPRDGRLLRVARFRGRCGWILGTARWHQGGFLSGWISRGVGGPNDGLGLAEPTHWASFAPPAAQPREDRSAEQDPISPSSRGSEMSYVIPALDCPDLQAEIDEASRDDVEHKTEARTGNAHTLGEALDRLVQAAFDEGRAYERHGDLSAEKFAAEDRTKAARAAVLAQGASLAAAEAERDALALRVGERDRRIAELEAALRPLAVAGESYPCRTGSSRLREARARDAALWSYENADERFEITVEDARIAARALHPGSGS